MDAKDREVTKLEVQVAFLSDLLKLALSHIPESVRRSRQWNEEYLAVLRRTEAAAAGLPKLEPEALPPEMKLLLAALEEEMRQHRKDE